MKYFIATVEQGSVTKAAKALAVSPGSVSKALAKIEEESGTLLFFRKGRGLEVTPEAIQLATEFRKASELLASAFERLNNTFESEATLRVAGTEFTLWSQSKQLLQILQKHFPKLRLELIHTPSDAACLELVEKRQAHLGYVLCDSPAKLDSRLLHQIPFQTAASSMHPWVLKKAKKPIQVSIDEVVEQPFLSLSEDQYGSFFKPSSYDGWNDHMFKRQTVVKSTSLFSLQNIMALGQHLIYAPRCVVERWGLVPIEVLGCDLSCAVNLRVVTASRNENLVVGKVWRHI